MKNTVKYLKDYKSLPVKVNSINLRFDIQDDCVQVVSLLEIEPLEVIDTIVLDGEAKLVRISLRGKRLTLDEDYSLTEKELTIFKIPNYPFSLEIKTELYPDKNKSLMGLYSSQGSLFTQCEAEGFRKITYFFDRPDIMTEYTVTIEADKKQYPVLLSNGNKIKQGSKDNRHWVTWHDPYKKPSYLFALVAGRLEKKEDIFRTMSGKEVALHFYCRSKDIDKIDFAILSLKKAMAWDEARFNLEYDLDVFMVVAVDDFNMGAMENKGLNIFNTQYVLATSRTATDRDFAGIESVIGHEYFHNYTGNRVTCRDWFQLTLKEGLTVFRDQEFSSDMSSRIARRIQAVKVLREFQFAEDAGPLAHPIRPQEYEEINNFYTMTVYEKGAEVIRMLHTILGEEGFQKGMELYFKRHDGQAVTCEDFFWAMSDANDLEISQFLRWYDYAGTPEVKVKKYFNKEQKKVLIKLKQKISGKHKKPLLIPIKIGFLTKNGRKQSYKLENFTEWQDESVLLLRNKKASLELKINSNSNPVLSVGRGFSAPIKIKYKQSENELLTLMAHDSDEFIRWDSTQILYKKYIKRFLKAKQKGQKYPPVLVLTSKLNKLIKKENDYALLSLILDLPSFSELLEEHAPIDPVLLQKVILDFKLEIALNCYVSMEPKYISLVAYEAKDPFSSQERYHPKSEWVRALINTLRSYLVFANKDYFNELTTQYEQLATNMTHRIGILEAIKHIESKTKDYLMDSFANEFKEEDLVLDKYFRLIASSFAKNTFEKIKEELQSSYFDITNPNKIRSLLGTFTRNSIFFHQKDGEGYHFIIKLIAEIEKFNPIAASGLVNSFEVVNMLDKVRQKLIQEELSWLLNKSTSSDVQEIANKIYKSIDVK